ncbi:DEAD/DEAH box helicase [Rhodothermaceae bacterium RA]|nr:DEAD/DEAH box helicase [Rhodothermaceae bacterium RA]
MADASPSSGSPYTQVIDLTTRGQQERKREQGAVGFAEPDPPLPDATLDTVPPSIRKAAASAGWPGLTPVQQKTIPYILDRRDLIVQSRTGSGKTGAFLLPLFELIDPARKVPQVLILTPTRELARQIHEEFERMRGSGEDASPLMAALIYGGVRYGPQLQALKDGAQVVIGTPGRILDHLERGNLRLETLEMLILDEADEMLSMGFYPAMRQLKRYLPERRTSYMFSATMPPKVQSLGREFLRDPGFLGLSAGQESVDTIEHLTYTVDPMTRDRALVRLIEMENPDSAIIFANTKRDVEYLTQFLRNYGHDADEISGDLSQQQREKVMDQIRDGELRFLVATDVAARGIDISDLSHVFMYDVPQDPEYYLHRAGRTGRIGKSGRVIVLVTPVDKNTMLRIARRYGFEVDQRELPSDEDVRARISERLTVQLEERLRSRSNLEKERMQRFVPLAEELAREEPELLAMLLDELYHRSLHAPARPLSAEEEAERKQHRQRPKSERGRGGRGGGRGGSRGGRGGGRRGGGRGRKGH